PTVHGATVATRLRHLSYPARGATPYPGRRGYPGPVTGHRTRPVIGMLQRELSGLYAEQWLGAVEAARALDCALICFSGRRLGEAGDKRLANVVYDLATSESVDGLVVWTTALGALVGPEGMAPFGQRYEGLPIVSIEEPLGSAPVVLMGDRR